MNNSSFCGYSEIIFCRDKQRSCPCGGDEAGSIGSVSHDRGERTARVNRERKSDGQPGASFVPVRSLNGSSMNAHKSFQKKGGGESGPEAGRDFHGEKRSNETHESKTDPESRLYKKSY